MSAEGQAVAAECWAAAIPVQLRLAESEVSSLEQPPVLYMLVPRQSYLHSLVPRALRMLQHLLPPGEDMPWFEHGHLPLKWNVPAGVLYDLVAAPTAALPWSLTIHFRTYPSKMLPAYGGEAALRGAFFHSLKEAAVISRGSAQRVMEMAAGAQDDLFRQALAANHASYRSILASLQLAPAAQRGGQPRVPLRLYVRTDAGGYLSSYEDIVSTSRPVAALAADGSPVSLQDALLPLVSECLQRHGVSGTAAAAGVQSQPGTPRARGSSVGDSGDGGTEAAAPAAESSKGCETGSSMAALSLADGRAAGTPDPSAAAEAAVLLEQAAAAQRLLVGGAAPPLDAPLAWLHAQLHAPDFFLYVTLHLALPRA